MPKQVELHLPHAPVGDLYAEEAGHRLLFVSTDLRADQTAELEALRTALAALAEKTGAFDNFEIALAD